MCIMIHQMITLIPSSSIAGFIIFDYSLLYKYKPLQQLN